MDTNIAKSSLTQLGNSEWTQNWTLGGLELYGEIRDDQTKEVWLCQQPISHEEFQELELPEGFSRALFGRGAHDAAYFPRPPEGTEDSPSTNYESGQSHFFKSGSCWQSGDEIHETRL